MKADVIALQMALDFRYELLKMIFGSSDDAKGEATKRANSWREFKGRHNDELKRKSGHGRRG